MFEVTERRGRLKPTVILTLFLAGGFLAYVAGLFRGFLLLLGGALFQIVNFNIVFSMPVLILASYSHFSIVYLPSFPATYYGLTPLSIWFLLFGAASVIFALFGRYVGVSLSAFTALIFGVIQFLLVSSIFGFELVGGGLALLPTNPTGTTPYVVLFCEKSFVALIFSTILLGAGTIYAQYLQHMEAKRLLSRFEAPSLEHFKIIKAAQIKKTILPFPLLIFLVAGIYDWLLLRLEFPNYYIFMGLFNWGSKVFFNSLLITVSLFNILIMAVLSYGDLNKFLAKNYTSVIVKILEENPVLPFEVVQRSLKVEEVSQKHLELDWEGLFRG